MGGKLREDISKKHQQNTQRILEIFNPIHDSTHRLGEAIEKNLAQGIWKPNTARTYIQSFKTFLTFLGTMIVSQHLGYKHISMSTIELVKAQVSRIATTLSSMCLKEKKAMGEEDGDRSINPNDLKTYLTSDRAESAENLLKSSSMVTRDIHTTVRNYLIMRIATSNAHRTACISNMTLTEFNNAKMVDGDCVVYVHKHKTSKTFGPAEVVLTYDLFQSVSTYVKKFRPKSSTNELFLAWGGLKMDSAGILNCFGTELAYVGIEKK